MNKECIICYNPFIARDKRQKCCSKECSKINIKRYFETNTSRIKQKKYRENPKVSARQKKYLKNYHQTEKFKLADKIYHERFKNSEDGKLYLLQYNRKYNKLYKRKIYIKKWNKTIPGKINKLKKSLKRRAIENNIIEKFSIIDWQRKVEATKGICPCCYTIFNSGEYKLSLDHNPSLSKSNRIFLQTGIRQIYTIDNIQPLCLKCNMTKGDKDITIEELRKIRKINETNLPI